MYLHSTTLEDQMQSTKLLVATMEVCSECVCVCVCDFLVKRCGEMISGMIQRKNNYITYV